MTVWFAVSHCSPVEYIAEYVSVTVLFYVCVWLFMKPISSYSFLNNITKTLLIPVIIIASTH